MSAFFLYLLSPARWSPGNAARLISPKRTVDLNTLVNFCMTLLLLILRTLPAVGALDDQELFQGLLIGCYYIRLIALGGPQALARGRDGRATEGILLRLLRPPFE